MSVSALHYLGHTNISSWGKKKEKTKHITTNMEDWKAQEKSVLILVLHIEANFWVQSTNALIWHCLAIISKAPKNQIEMPSWNCLVSCNLKDWNIQFF